MLLAFVWVSATCAADSSTAAGVTREAGFVLSAPERSATIFVDRANAPAVVRVAGDLAADVERVTDRKPVVSRATDTLSGDIVILGVLGQDTVIDALVAGGKLNVTGLAGSWESFAVQVVEAPLPNVRRALVIVGSDRRGAIYGAYEISSMIGVSPWYWWADVVPRKQAELVIPADTRRFGPPSVKYRGIFLNDEDWGLQPWAAKTFEPDSGNIGPKTYARLFELMLRLRANTVWPAMHPGTAPFNAFPENKRIADEYGIVMGSSHAEPMLRNNVGEWTAPKEAYNYLTNRDGVLKYWDQRVAENGQYENIYTLGMRGIHDSNMQGPKTDAERIAALQRIFADQRQMIAKHVNPNVEQVPQMFCAYKEVLDLYRQGLEVPEDITIVWPDDNFGFVRNFANAQERSRAGGFGVYYHLSYLGRPLSYLWLSTTPPALVWEEMHKAYEHGADRIWIANVGDLKPAEISTEFFLQMAWDITRWGPHNLAGYLDGWATREFGAENGPEIAKILGDYYVLNFQRRPEHLQWWLPRQPPQPSPWSDEAVKARLAAFGRIRAAAEALAEKIPAPLRDAYFELVQYPVSGSALANVRYFEGERGNPSAALAADGALKDLTRQFNEEVAHGKWRGIMTLEPADNQWSSMRIAKWEPGTAVHPKKTDAGGAPAVTWNAADFVSKRPGMNAGWVTVPGLGHGAGAVTVLPTTVPSVTLAPAVETGPALEYRVEFPTAGDYELTVHVLPTHPISGSELRVGVAFDDAPAKIVSVPADDGGATWAQGVLAGERLLATPIRAQTAGAHVLHVYNLDPGIVVDRFTLSPKTANAEK